MEVEKRGTLKKLNNKQFETLQKEVNNTKDSKEIKQMYMENFMCDLPPLLMIQCGDEDNPNYIAMLKHALINGRPVTEEDWEMFFPVEDGVDY